MDKDNVEIIYQLALKERARRRENKKSGQSNHAIASTVRTWLAQDETSQQSQEHKKLQEFRKKKPARRFTYQQRRDF